MQTKTALAVAGSVLAVPSTALAATDTGQRHPRTRGAPRLRPPDPRRRQQGPPGPHEPAPGPPRGAAERGPAAQGLRRRVRDDSVSVIRLPQPAPAPGHHPARAPRASTASAPLAGDRRLRVRRRPGDEHRQRVLRQVPVHAGDLAERRRHRQPGRGLRGRAGPPRRAALRAVRQLALARLRPVAPRTILRGRDLGRAARAVPDPRAHRVPERRHRRARAAGGAGGGRARARVGARGGAREGALRAPLRAPGRAARGLRRAARRHGRRHRADDVDERGARQGAGGHGDRAGRRDRHLRRGAPRADRPADRRARARRRDPRGAVRASSPTRSGRARPPSPART